MFFELAEDIFDVILINQEILPHDGFYIQPLFSTVQDLLLVMERNLRVRNQNGGDQRMGNETLCTKYALYRKPDPGRAELHRPFVMSITDQAPFPPAGTFDPMELKAIYRTIINILRKIIAVFKDNCYHTFAGVRRSISPGALCGKTG